MSPYPVRLAFEVTVKNIEDECEVRLALERLQNKLGQHEVVEIKRLGRDAA